MRNRFGVYFTGNREITLTTATANIDKRDQFFGIKGRLGCGQTAQKGEHGNHFGHIRCFDL